MSNSYLHEDLLILVLVRLPVKSLGQFKSVSKSWNALISSQEFVKLHLNLCFVVGQNPNVLVFGTVLDLCTEELHMVEFSIAWENKLELGWNIERLHNPFEKNRWQKFVGCCNGLVCLFQREECGGISLCNPLTKSSWFVPVRKDIELYFYGFGYDDVNDDVNDDYKVMIATRDFNNNRRGYVFEVYSLRSNSWRGSWREVRSYRDPHNNYGNLLRCVEGGVSVNSTLHWLFGQYTGKRKRFILAFDIRTDEFTILRIPEVLMEKWWDLKLSVLNGRLVLFENYGRSAWVMKDYCATNESWMRIPIHDSRDHLWSLTPVALLEDNENRKLIYYDYKRGMILLYDLVSHRVLHWPAFDGFRYAKQFQFVASLVQPHPPPSTRNTPPKLQDWKAW